MKQLNTTLPKTKIVYFPALVIGKGAFGKVYYGLFNQKGLNELVAVKEIDACNDPKTNIEPEFKALNNLTDCENVVKLKDYITDANHNEKYIKIKKYFILEYCNRGNLEDYVNLNNLSDLEIRYIFRDMVNTLKFIHNKDIGHRDIKPCNIIFNEDIVKFVDFGECKQFQGEEITSTLKGTTHYINPQVLDGKNYNFKSADIFSLGVTLYFMYYKRLPCFKDKQEQRTKSFPTHFALLNLYKDKLNERDIDKIFTDEVYIDKDGKDLIKGMIHFNERGRFKIEDIINHPYMKFFKEGIFSPKRTKVVIPKQALDKNFIDDEKIREVFSNELKSKYAREILERMYFERSKSLFLNKIIRNLSKLKDLCSQQTFINALLVLTYFNHLHIFSFFDLIDDKNINLKLAKVAKWDAFNKFKCANNYYKKACKVLEEASEKTYENYQNLIESINKSEIKISEEFKLLLIFNENIELKFFSLLQKAINEIFNEVFEIMIEAKQCEEFLIKFLYDLILLLNWNSICYSKKKKIINFEKYFEEESMKKNIKIMKKRIIFFHELTK